MNVCLATKNSSFYVANLRNRTTITCDWRLESDSFRQQSTWPRLNQRSLSSPGLFPSRFCCSICAALSLTNNSGSSVTGKTYKKSNLQRVVKPIVALLCAFSLAGCVYKVDILQGNHLDPDAIDQIEVGMTRSQVRFILGTPMVKDPFHADRWDYVYYFKKGGSDNPIRDRLIVYFDGDKVASLDRNAPIG